MLVNEPEASVSVMLPLTAVPAAKGVKVSVFATKMQSPDTCVWSMKTVEGV